MEEFNIIENNENFDIENWEQFCIKNERDSFTSSDALGNIEIKQGGSLYSRLMLVGATTIMVCSTDASAKEQVKYIESDSEVKVIETYSKLVVNPFLNFMYELEKYIPKKESKKSEIIKKIVSFKALIQSWDGFGAYPLEVDSAVNSLELINKLSNDSIQQIKEIFPTPNGTVSVMWENISEERVSLEIGNQNYSFYVKYNLQEPLFFEGTKIEGKELEELERHIECL